jgi:ankyrin repeat protein
MNTSILSRYIFALMFVSYSSTLFCTQTSLLPFKLTVDPVHGTQFKTAAELVWDYVELKNAGGLADLLKSVLGNPHCFVTPPLPLGVNFFNASAGMKTPLYRATELYDAASVNTLLVYGANPDMACYAGNTPLHYAVMLMSYDIIRVLLQRNVVTGHPLANPNVRNNAGFTPLLILAEVGHNGIERALRMRYPDPAIVIQSEKTRLAIAELLISAGADVNARDLRGMSVLNFCLMCHAHDQLPVSLIVYLIQQGLDLAAPYTAGQTNYQALEALGVAEITHALSLVRPIQAQPTGTLAAGAPSPAVRAEKSVVGGADAAEGLPASAEATAASVQAPAASSSVLSIPPTTQHKAAIVSASTAAPLVESPAQSVAAKASNPVDPAERRQKKKERKALARAEAASFVVPQVPAPEALKAEQKKELPKTAGASAPVPPQPKTEPQPKLVAQVVASAAPVLAPTSPKKAKQAKGSGGTAAQASAFSKADAARKAELAELDALISSVKIHDPLPVTVPAAVALVTASSAPAIAAEPIMPPYNYDRALAILRGVVKHHDLTPDELAATEQKALRARRYFAAKDPFFSAVLALDYVAVASMLADDPGLAQSITPQGNTALHIAAFMADVTMCSVLCGGGADVDAKNFLGHTPIMSIMKSLPTAGEVREAATFTYLAKRGADLRWVNKFGMTLVHYAVTAPYIAITAYLCEILPIEALTLTANRDIDAVADTVAMAFALSYNRGARPLELALCTEKKSLENRFVIKLLIDRLAQSDRPSLCAKPTPAIYKACEAYKATPNTATLAALDTAMRCSLDLKRIMSLQFEIMNPVYEAVYDRRINDVRELCTRDISRMVNVVYQQDQVSPLQLAVAQFDVEMVEMLLNAGADAAYAVSPLNQFMSGVTAMHIAAMGGVANVTPKALSADEKILALCKIIDLLVRKGASVQAMTVSSLDPLSCVIQSQRLNQREKIALIKCLAKRGASLTTIYPGNYTIMHQAVTYLTPGEVSTHGIVKVLGDLIGDNPAFYAHIYDGFADVRGTAMGEAIRIGDWQTMAYLFDRAGAEAYVPDTALATELMLLRDDINTEGLSVVEKRLAIASFLNRFKSIVSFDGPGVAEGSAAATVARCEALIADWDGLFLPPAICQDKTSRMSDAEYAEILRNKKEGLYQRINLSPSDVFLCAVLNQNYDTVGELITADKDIVNTVGVAGTTALHIAAWLGDVVMCHQLLEAGARVDAMATSGAPMPTTETPLLWLVAGAARNEEIALQVAELLIAAGARVDTTTDSSGYSLLMLAAAHRNYTVLDRLCRAAGQRVRPLMRLHCNKVACLVQDGVAGFVQLPRTFSAFEHAYCIKQVAALEIFIRHAQCLRLDDFLSLAEIPMPIDKLRCSVLERKWQLLLSATTPEARRLALEALCDTLHSFKKSF